MSSLQEYWLPYTISNIVGLIILILAWKRVRIARWLCIILFAYAGIYNLYIGFVKPDAYLGFSDTALPFYRDFINGWFSKNNHILIPLIAIGQLAVATGFLLKGIWVKLAAAGAIIFLIAIAPLGVGSAFPFSITVSIAAWLISKKDATGFPWKKLMPARYIGDSQAK